MRVKWLKFVAILSFLVVINGQQCEDPCLECNGICTKTPMGIKCKCPYNMTGDNCDLCLVKPLWFDAGNGYQYQYTDHQSNYIEVQNQCKYFGGHLAIYGMRDPHVYDEIAEMFPDAFVGLTDEAIEGTSLWNDVVRADQTWTPWGPGEPSNMLDKDCGYLSNSSGAFLLSDVNCSSIEYGLCEVPIGCPPRNSKYNSKNDCEYLIIPPAARHVSQRLCQQIGGTLAEKAVNTGNYLKKILYQFNISGQITEKYIGVFVGFERQGSMFISDSGNVLQVPNDASDWAPRNDTRMNVTVQDCVYATLSPDSINYVWLEAVQCDLLLPGLCEMCNGSHYLNQRTCKSGKMCPANTICVVHEGSCFEDCICIEDYVKINETVFSACIKDKCIGYGCGENACCVFDPVSNFVGCKCDKGYLPIGNDGEGCSLPCEDVACGENAFCVINSTRMTRIGICICFDGYLANMTAYDGCVLDLCASGELSCGNHSTCCIVDQNTTTQRCMCDEGYYFKENSTTECFDPCDDSDCGENAFCTIRGGVDPPEGHCIGLDGCDLDLCASGELSCGNHSTCCIVNQNTTTQRCVCDEGYYLKENSTTECFDPCASVVCESSAMCVITSNKNNPRGRCVCDADFMVNRTVDNGCIADKCQDGSIICGINAFCSITDLRTLAQGCMCEVGYNFDARNLNNCSDCPQTKYDFGGTISDYLTTDYHITGAFEFTLCAWVTPPSGKNLYGTLISSGPPSSSSVTDIFFSAFGLTVFVGGKGGCWDNFTVTERTHVCVVVSISNNTIALFVNGNANTTVEFVEAAPTYPPNEKIVIGQSTTGTGDLTEPFNGIAENLMLWARVLPDAEISAMYDNDCVCSGDFAFAPIEELVTKNGDVSADYSDC